MIKTTARKNVFFFLTKIPARDTFRPSVTWIIFFIDRHRLCDAAKVGIKKISYSFVPGKNHETDVQRNNKKNINDVIHGLT